jgi:hypothetical protein
MPRIMLQLLTLISASPVLLSGEKLYVVYPSLLCAPAIDQ